MIEILRQDKDILCCVKPVGVPVETADSAQKSLISILKEEQGQVYPVHRLDQGVGGVMVFAKTSTATANLDRAIGQGTMQKEYLTIVTGTLEEPKGTLTDLLFRDARKNKTYVVNRMRKGVREASLSYEVLSTVEHEGKTYSLLRVQLHTGRTHQIRIQFASRKHPLYGDRKYGATEENAQIALWSHSLCFPHPKNHDIINVSLEPPKEAPWIWFNL